MAISPSRTESVADPKRHRGRWQLGPSHPDYAYEGAHGYPVLPAGPSSVAAAPKRNRYVPVGRKRGPIIGRRYSLTPEGASAVSRADSAWSEPAASCAQPTEAPSGHIHCPAVLGCREGRLPWGWVREGGVNG